MTNEPGGISGTMRGLLRSGTPRDLSDGQLLERFADGRGPAAEWAFEALLDRHGPMVLRTCRGVLADPADALDAFQATFLVLIRKARGLWVRDSLGPWLHQVALRTARCARADAARRRRLERSLAAPSAGATPSDREAERILHEELGRLPERYRAPLVLCDLEGRTHEQAARHLGWPIGTVKSRQSRGREHLRKRLVRRGVGPEHAALAALPRLDLLPHDLVRGTIATMTRAAASPALGAGPVALLARQTLGIMNMTRWWKLAATLIALGATTSGAALLPRAKPQDDPLAAPSVRKPDPAKPKAAGDGVRVVEAVPGGFRPVLIERGSLESGRIERGISGVERPVTILSLLPEGARVTKGDVVCELDTSELRDNLINQEIAAKRAEAARADALADHEVALTAAREYADGTLKVERAALRAEIDGAQAALERAASRLERTKAVRDRVARQIESRGDAATPADLVARLELDDRIEEAEAAFARETAARDLAKSRLDVLETFTRTRITRGLETEVKRKAAAQLATEAAVRLEESREAKLKTQIAACTVRAPIDGVVRHSGGPAVAEGEIARERQVLFAVVDPAGPMLIDAKIPESSIDRVKPGQTARVRVDAFPDRSFTGEVKSVAPRPDPSGLMGGGGPKVYSTRVLIRDRTPDLTPGMTAEVRIAGEPSPRAIAVPKTALVLVSAGGGWIIVPEDGDRYDLRQVETGLSSETEIEVRSGLRTGERVVADPFKDLGDKVKSIMGQEPTKLDR